MVALDPNDAEADCKYVKRSSHMSRVFNLRREHSECKGHENICFKKQIIMNNVRIGGRNFPPAFTPEDELATFRLAVRKLFFEIASANDLLDPYVAAVSFFGIRSTQLLASDLDRMLSLVFRSKKLTIDAHGFRWDKPSYLQQTRAACESIIDKMINVQWL